MIALYSPVTLADVLISSFPGAVVHYKVEVISSKAAKETGDPRTSYFPNIASPPHPQTIQEQSESNSDPPGFSSLSCFSKTLFPFSSRDFFLFEVVWVHLEFFFLCKFANPYLIQGSERNQGSHRPPT